jgi:hypothetical protein
MNVKKYKLLRDLPAYSRGNYSGQPLPKNTELYECIYHTYGCITENGIALTFSPDGDYPFFEVQRDFVEKI